MTKRILLLSTVFLASCATPGMFNTYIDFSNVEANEQSLCVKNVASTNAAGTTVPETIIGIGDAFKYACGVRNKYRSAMGGRSKLRRGASLPIIGLGATSIGLGVSGYDSTTILATGLTGATLATTGSLFDSSSDERAYVLGSQAVNCAMQAITPLVSPADAKDLEKFNSYLSEKKPESIEAKMSALKSAILAAEAAGLNLKDVPDKKLILNAQITAARELILLSETTIRNARALRSQRIQAPANLMRAVDQIISQVDISIQQNAISIDQTVSVIKGLASNYSTLTSVPTDLVSAPTGTTGGGEADTVDPKDVASVKADTQKAFKQFTQQTKELKRIEESRNFLSPYNRVQDGGSFQWSNSENGIGNRLILKEDGIQKGRGNKEWNESLNQLNNVISQLGYVDVSSEPSAIFDKLGASIDTAKQNRDSSYKELISLLDKYGLSLDKVQEFESNLSTPSAIADARSKVLSDAIAEVDLRRRLLADIVNSVVALKPAESLKACGVDPDSIVTALNTLPARVEFVGGSTGAQFVIINGGQPPFSASLAGTDTAVKIDKADPFSASFSVSYTGEGQGRRDILVVDGRNKRMVIPVNITAAPKPTTPVEPEVLDPEKVEERADKSRTNLEGWGKDNTKNLQAAVCASKFDGDWKKNSQSKFEFNYSAYGTENAVGGIVTVEIANAIVEKYANYSMSRENFQSNKCPDGTKLELPSK